jgi:hypothetical protein
MAKLRGAKDGKPFVKNDPRINKNGRPKRLPDLDELLTEVLSETNKGKEYIKLVLIALRKKAASGDVRACELLLDRTYGKLVTKKDIDLTFDSLNEEDLDRIIERLLKKENDDDKGTKG